MHSLPVLTALRERFPQAHITWVVNRTYEPLLAGHPHLDATLGFDRGAFRKGAVRAVAYPLRFAGELRRRRFDLVIDLQGLLRTGLMTAVGFALKGFEIYIPLEGNERTPAGGEAGKSDPNKRKG